MNDKLLKDNDLSKVSGGLDNRESDYYKTFWAYNEQNKYFYAVDAMELPNTSFKLFGYVINYDPSTNTYTESDVVEENTSNLKQIYIIPSWYRAY